EGYFNAAVALCGQGGQATNPIGLLSAHALEIGLKAVLLKSGSTEKDLKDIGHDLVHAWQKTAPKIGLSAEAPYWVDVLNFSHSAPYYYRYSSAEFGVAIPACEDLKGELGAVLDAVRAKVTE